MDSKMTRSHAQPIRTILALLLFATVLASTFAVAAAGVIDSYAIVPQQTFVAPGELCTLTVEVDVPGDSLGCVECRVTFDTTLVTLVLAEEGQLFKDSVDPGLFFWVPVTADTHSVEGCILGYRTYVLAPGEVARFIFQADLAGVCPVRITKLRLWDIDRNVFEPDVDPSAWIFIGGATGVRPQPDAGFDVRAYPNPFNPTTTVVVSGLEAAAGEYVDVSVYSVSGRLVARLFDGRVARDEVRVIWNGRDGAGRRVGSGVYFALARAGSQQRVQKLVLLQ